MSSPAFALFDTSLGTCATVWGASGLLGFALPERSEHALRARLRSQYGQPDEQPPNECARQVIDGVRTLLEGRAADLSFVELDMSNVPAFHRRVYVAAREVPFGATITYGELAARLGSPNAARAVGQALGRNPFAIVVPCHRIVGASGKLVGFTAHGGISTKQRLLTIEGVATSQSRSLPLSADW